MQCHVFLVYISKAIWFVFYSLDILFVKKNAGELTLKDILYKLRLLFG